MLTHVCQRFQPVGHGTFFTGIVSDDSSKGFSWVYDCGSRRPNHVVPLVGRLNTWVDLPQELDVLVISHFDVDHVNGIRELLKSRRVKRMVLPFMDIGQQLENVMELLDDEEDTEENGSEGLLDAVLLQLVPVRWLAANGFEDNVGELMFVQSGGPAEEGENIEPFPDSGGNESDRVAVSEEYVLSTRGAEIERASVRLVEDSARRRAGTFPVELTFFNSMGSDLFETDDSGQRLSRLSQKTVKELRDQLATILSDLGMDQPEQAVGSASVDWRGKLREFYDGHFGGDGHHRNNISLCLMIRPLGKELRQCKFFKEHGPMISAGVSSHGGLLLLGDLGIDQNRFAELKAHFGHKRWSSLSAIQVPHHGSQHSWATGTAKMFGDLTFVHCAPGDKKLPHPSVERDLQGNGTVHIATYKVGVELDYHF